VLGLGALALLRPLTDVTGVAEALGRPFGLVAVLALNALWGLAAGAFALGVRSALDGRQRRP
jgi:hypothetical protein